MGLVATAAQQLAYAPPGWHSGLSVFNARKRLKIAGRWTKSSETSKHKIPSHGIMQLLFLAQDGDLNKSKTYLLISGRGTPGISFPTIKLAERIHDKLRANVCLMSRPGEQGNEGTISQASSVAAIQAALAYLTQGKGIDPLNINTSASSIGANLAAVALGLLGQEANPATWGAVHLYSPPVLKNYRQLRIKSKFIFDILNFLLKGKLLETVSPKDALELCRYIHAKIAWVHHSRGDKIVGHGNGEEFHYELSESPFIEEARFTGYKGNEHHNLGAQVLEAELLRAAT